MLLKHGGRKELSRLAGGHREAALAFTATSPTYAYMREGMARIAVSAFLRLPLICSDLAQRCDGCSHEACDRVRSCTEPVRIDDRRCLRPGDQDRRRKLVRFPQLNEQCVGGGDLTTGQCGCLAHGSRLLCSRDQGPELVLQHRSGPQAEYLLTRGCMLGKVARD